MTPAGAQAAVVTSMLGTGIVASVPSLAGAHWPTIRVVSGIAITGTFLAFLAPVAPGPIGGLAVLILIGSVLTWGPAAVVAVKADQTPATPSAVLRTVTRRGSTAPGTPGNPIKSI